jgi:hypothetical protein
MQVLAKLQQAASSGVQASVMAKPAPSAHHEAGGAQQLMSRDGSESLMTWGAAQRSVAKPDWSWVDLFGQYTTQDGPGGGPSQRTVQSVGSASWARRGADDFSEFAASQPASRSSRMPGMHLCHMGGPLRMRTSLDAPEHATARVPASTQQR